MTDQLYKDSLYPRNLDSSAMKILRSSLELTKKPADPKTSTDPTFQERTIPGCPWSFADDMRRMIDNKQFSDMRFIVGAERRTIFANRGIVTARCEVFHAMFDNVVISPEVVNDTPLVLADVNPDIFLTMLEFVYTNTCTLNSKNVMDVLSMAMEYGLQQLQKICERFIAETLSIDTVCGALQVAVMYGEEELKQVCMQFIEDNSKHILTTKGFHDMNGDTLAQILSSDNLEVDEIDIINAVREWATVNSVVKGKSVHELARPIVKYIRLPLLTPLEIKKAEADNTDEMIPVDMFARSWKFHALKKTGQPVTPPIPRRGTQPRDLHE